MLVASSVKAVALSLRVRIATLLLGVVLSGCTGSADVDDTPVAVEVRIEHAFDGKPLELGADYASHGDPALRVTRLNYYVGQFRLQHEDGRWFSSAADAATPGDYRLVDAAQPSSLAFPALRVPPGRYKTIEFLLGVDDARNSGGAQTGALDPAGGMFWTWNTGFIFFALEGHAATSGARDGALTFHLGGDARLGRTLVLPLAPDALVVEAGAQPVVRLRADVGRFFDGLALADTHTVMTPSGADPLADRFAQLFAVERGAGAS